MTEKKISPSKPDFKAIKIDNAAWMPEIAEHIQRFCQKAHVDGVQPGNLQTYFAQVAQGLHGKHTAEFWMVFEDEKPVAFASWTVLGLPHIAKVYWFALYSWQKTSNEPVELLVDEYIKFGKKWNAVWFGVDLVSKSLVKLITRIANKRGYDVTESGLTHLTMRKPL